MRFDGLLFDLDGTLWDAVPQITAAWNRVIAPMRGELEAYGKAGPLTPEGTQPLFGKTMDVIADALFGDFPGKNELAERCFAYENEYLSEQPGQVYDGTEETLAALSERMPLFVVSNCQAGYIETFLEATGLSRYFSGHLCFGDTGRPKGENIRRTVEKYGLRAPAYVGDTQGDADAAAEAGVPFIHAAYGFGKVQNPDFSVKKIQDLMTLL